MVEAVEAVEAAKAQNPFATQAPQATEYCCPHMERLGICLEPAMCFLIHKIPASAGGNVPSELSTSAKAFNPFAANAGKAEAKEFVP